MAPALVERPVDNSNLSEAVWKKDKVQGEYKEAFSQSAATTNYETEINGSETQKPAKYPNYLPCKSTYPSH